MYCMMNCDLTHFRKQQCMKLNVASSICNAFAAFDLKVCMQSIQRGRLPWYFFLYATNNGTTMVYVPNKIKKNCMLLHALHA